MELQGLQHADGKGINTGGNILLKDLRSFQRLSGTKDQYVHHCGTVSPIANDLHRRVIGKGAVHGI